MLYWAQEDNVKGEYLAITGDRVNFYQFAEIIKEHEHKWNVYGTFKTATAKSLEEAKEIVHIWYIQYGHE